MATFDLDNGVTNAGGGTISFHTSQADAIADVNPIANKDAYTAATGTTIWVRSENANGCFSVRSFTLTVTDNPDVTANNAEICAGESIDLNTLITDADGGTITFHASQADADAGANPIAQPVSPAVTTTYYVRSTNGDCFGTTSLTITVNACGGFCTYTQGYYGNLGGLSCNGEPADPGPNQFTTLQTITNALNAWGGTLTVGCPGHSVSITLGNEQCVVDKLPGGGAPKALPAGDINICNLTSAYLKNGVINNALLAQTITLGLNMGVDGDLGGFALEANKWLVTADVTECGSTTVKDCEFSCVDNGDGTFTWAVTYSPFHVGCRISQALYDALATKDVAGLYALANSALCGNALPTGVSYTDISNAEDCINNAFDGCRNFITWASGDVAPSANSFCDLPSNTTPCGSRTLARPTTESAVSTDNLKVTAYPNPFTNLVKFTIQSNISGQASLDIYNSVGQRVSTVYKGYLQANRGQVVEYRAPRIGSNLIYILRVGSKQVTGKLLRLE
jgi:hypothetical protein